MNKKQYNNIIKNTLKRVHTEDSLSTARAVFKNMGVALPGGDMKEVFETVKTNNYMGWKSCTMEEAQAAANKGTAAIGISDSKIVVLAANDAEEPIEPTAEVLAITDSTPAVAVAGLQYYSYGYGGTSTGGSSTSTSTVRRSNFGSIEYKGHTYEIFVPNHLETTINPVWTTVETVIKKGDIKFDKWKFLAGLQFPKYTGGLNVAGGDFSDDISRSVVCRAEIKTKIGFVGIFIGAINAASDAYDQLFVKATFQKTSDNRRRVILEAGSIEAERKFSSFASNVPISAYYNNAGRPLNQAGILTAVGNLYEEITGNSKSSSAIYDCQITVDSQHKNDSGALSYLWIDVRGRIMETPIIYKKDKVSFGIQHGIFGSGTFESFYNPNLLGSFQAKSEYQNLFGKIS